MIRYILVTGAPGSRWSGFVEDHLYTRDDIDTTDRSPEREYYHNGQLLHRGAYFDSGMEFNNFPENWHLPFSGTGVRVIKSHLFAFNVDYVKKFTNEIYLVWRPDDECYKWWHEAGGWDITYPKYKPYYFNDEGMMNQIRLQNEHILRFAEREGLEPWDDGKRIIYKWQSTENG